MLRTVVAAAIAIGALLAARPVTALPSDQACLTCHASNTLGPGRTGTSLTVDGAALRGSAHGKLGCTTCHRDAEGASHAARLAEVRCASCHAAALRTAAASVHAGSRATAEGSCRGCHGPAHVVAAAPRASAAMCASCHRDVVAQYEQSVHGRAVARGDPDASTCEGCHGPAHALRSHRDSLATTSHARLPETCGRCHADREIVERHGITIPQAVQLFRESVHGRSRDPRAAVCNDCHESHDLRRAADPASSIYRTNIPTTCGRCHPSEVERYRAGVHGRALARGVTASPVCTSCHGEHMIRGPHEPGSPVANGRVSETCSHCHEAEGIRQTFGLPAGRLSSYRDSYHGLAARGGSPAVANCASCHGFHDILPSSDPRSSVAPARLSETCGKCHAGAGAKFRLSPVHVAEATPDQPVLYWVRIGYLWLIGLTVGFMLLHNGLDFASKLRRHLAAHLRGMAPARTTAVRWFVRMTPAERIQHGLLAASFLTLVYTGFALKFPETWLFAWFARLESGYRWRSLVHRGAAVVMIGVAVFHLGTLLTRRGRRLLQDLRPSPVDAAALGQNLLHLAGLRAEPPRIDRFGYIEKLEYWALVWGTVIMSITGLVLWFDNLSLRMLAKWVLDLATLVHYYEAWLALLAILVWHVYQNVLNPDVYPMNWTWITGRISEDQLRHEHALEWERLAREEADKAAEAAAESESEPGA